MVTVITGASKGIGKALALKFGKSGHQLALCARGIQELQQVKTEVEKAGCLSPYIQAVDVSKKQEVLDFAEHIFKKYNKVDVLINNAGVFLPGEILNEADGRLEYQIETNVYSAYHMSRAIAPQMKINQAGHIFNMCSIASQTAYPNGGSYTISKFALLGMSKVLREELKPFGVKVTSVMPGATWSASWAGVDLPEERLMQANDIAEMVYAASKLSASAVVEELVIRPQLGDL